MWFEMLPRPYFVWGQILENLAFQDFDSGAQGLRSDALGAPHLPSSRGLSLGDWPFLPGRCCCVHLGANLPLSWKVLSPAPENRERDSPPSHRHRLCDFCVHLAKLDLKLYSFKPRDGCRDRIIHLSPISHHLRILTFTKRSLQLVYYEPFWNPHLTFVFQMELY